MGLAQGDTLHTITPAFSSISISSRTHCTCFRARVYGFWLTGGLSPVGMSILRRGVFHKSDESFEKISANSSHNFSKDSHASGGTSASLRIIGSRGSTSAGNFKNPISAPLNGSSSDSFPGSLQVFTQSLSEMSGSLATLLAYLSKYPKIVPRLRVSFSCPRFTTIWAHFCFPPTMVA